jgi:hypothetical protein
MIQENEISIDLPLRSESTKACRDTQQESIKLGKIVRIEDWVVWFRWGMHLLKYHIWKCFCDPDHTEIDQRREKLLVRKAYNELVDCSRTPGS